MAKKYRQNRSLKKTAARRGANAPRKRSASPVKKDNLLRTAVILVVLYTLILSAFSLVQHYNLRTQMADLGNADQAIWAASRGDWRMTVSNDSSGDLTSRFSIHANILFLLIAPLYVILPNPAILLVITTLASAAAGLGLFFLARHVLSPDSPWTLVPILLFYINPIVHDANLYDFHIITIATALLTWSIWGFETRHLKTAWICFCLAILCKEDVPLVTAMLGLYLFFNRRRREGVVAIAVSILYLLIFYSYVLPLVTEGHSLQFVAGKYARHTWMGSSLREMLWTIVSSPLKMLKVVLSPDHVRLPIYLLLLGGLAGIRSWGILLLTLPYLGVAMTTDNGGMTSIVGTYYWMPSVAFIIIACIFAARKTLNEGKRPWQLIYLGVAGIIASFLFSPLPHGAFSDWANYAPNPYREQMLRITSEIPDDASLCVQNNLGPHFSERRDIAEAGPRCAYADYILYHIQQLGGPNYGMFYRSSDDLYRRTENNVLIIARLLQSDAYGLVKQENRFYLFKKGAPSEIPKRQALEQLDKDYRNAIREIRAEIRYNKWRRYLVGNWE